MEKQICNECGTKLLDVSDCKEYFDRMIAWDFADFTGVGQVHHLTVLCYYLQHPSHFSPEGLKQAVGILKKVIENNLSDKELYQEESETFSSSQRAWNVTGTDSNHGEYSQEIIWSITGSEVTKDGVSKYPEYVKEWARAIYNDLKMAKELV